MIARRMLTVCLLIGLAHTQSIDDLIDEVFGTMTSSTDGNYQNPNQNLNPNQNPNPIPNQNSSPSPNPNPTPNPNPSPNFNPNPEAAANFTGCPTGKECVPLYLCKNDLIITDGETLIDIRFDGDTPQECPSLEQCCAVSDKVDVPLITPKPTPEGCGYRNDRGIGFKITGDKKQETQYGEFPWMVAILKEEQAGNQIFNIYQCGASLIHPSVVLTAAHCVDGKMAKTFKVRAGEWDTQTKAELFPDQDRNVVDVVVHPNYYRGALFNDIALLFVDQPFDIIDNVRTICLPPANTNFDRSRCFATGWGKDTFGQAGKYQVILKKIDIPVVPRTECQNALRNTRLGSHFELHQSFICAGGEPGKDTCKGDGGSPMVCPIQGVPERYYQAGIVAWGIGCGDAVPGVYASVSTLRPWIDEQLAYKKIGSADFTP